MGVSVCGYERPLGLFEVLARNRQSAVELFGRSRSAREKPPRMCAIPPRQRLSVTRRLAIRTWRATHDLKSQVSFINKKRIRERSFRFRTREIREYKQRDKYIHRYGTRNSSELKLRETHVQKAKRKPVITPTSHVITNRNTIGAQRGLISLC